MSRIAAIIIAIFVLIVVIGYFAFYYVSMKNVNSPKYQVISRTSAIEVRKYPALLVAEVTVSGDREEAISKGFRLLADYIFGNNQAMGGEKIAMTAPVIQQKSEKIAMTAPVIQSSTSAGQWQVRFVMPAKYTLQTLPKPKNSAVKIYEQPAQKVIAIKFSGRMTQLNLQQHLQKLQQYIKTHNIKVQGDPIYAFYNPPWTLPFMRRNEIMYNLTNVE